MGPLLLWACSGDPKDQGLLGQNPSQSQQAADAISGNEGIVGSGNEQVATNGSVVEVPVEEVKTGNDAKPDEPKVQVPPIAQGSGSNSGTEENENSVTPPHKVTGAFLVGEVISDEASGTVQIGIVAKQDDIRLSEQPERFGLNWRLQADESFGNSLRLVATKNPAYDRILEFDGSLEELESFGSEVAIHLLVSEDAGEIKLESAVKTSFSDLMNPVVEE